MQKIIFKKKRSNIFSFIILFIILNLSLNIVILSTIAQNNSNWQITIDLYPEISAKNQEVLLIIRIEDNNGMPVPDMPLNITLKNLSPDSHTKEIQFLNEPYLKTNEKGEYTTIFNAPIFEWYRDGIYEINVRVRSYDGTILSKSREFQVKEKIFDTKYDQSIEPAPPGSWYSVILYNVDFETFTASVYQNGVKEQKTWEKNDWESIGGESVGNKETGEKNFVYEIHSYEDEFTILFRFDGNSQSLDQTEEYPDKTLIYKFLVTDISGKEINITFSYYSNGQQIIESYDIPSVTLLRPTIGLTDRLGRWWFFKNVDGADRLGTGQNSEVFIYGIGFKENVKLKIFNSTNIIYEEDKISENYVTFFKWHVPTNIEIGTYNLTLEGYDVNDIYFKHEINFYIKEEPKKLGISGGESFFESYENTLYSFIIIILVIILVMVAYTRLKRKKLLNHIIRKRIYEHIELKPGIHFRALLNNLQLNIGTLTHHLKILEREKFIREYQDGMYRRFSLFSETPTKTINLPIIQENLLTIIKENPGITQSNISKKTGNSRSNINYHIKILNDSGMISIEKQGRISQCYLTK